jgi:hypothetical protein
MSFPLKQTFPLAQGFDFGAFSSASSLLHDTKVKDAIVKIAK